jgi:aspartate/methionine/tyrosine aminotransferase
MGTKAARIAAMADNELLQAPTISAMRQSDQDLSVDQPTVAPDGAILAASLQAMEAGNTHYVDVPGIPALRAALAAAMSDLGLRGYEQSNMLVTAGIQEARFLAVQKIGESFDGIGVPTVVHPGVRQALGTRARSITPIPVDKANYLPAVDAIRAALADGCPLLYLESPSRLSGAAYGPAQVAEIAALLKEYDAAAIWDQGLAPWAEEYHSLGGEPGMNDRVAVLGEAWPGQGLESWAIAYVGAKADWFEPMRSQKQIMAICTSTAAQYAALKAAELSAAHHAAQAATLAQLRTNAASQVSAAGLDVVPGDAANLLAVRGGTADAVATKLGEAGYKSADGADFGAAGVMRLVVMQDNVIGQALSSL